MKEGGSWGVKSMAEPETVLLVFLSDQQIPNLLSIIHYKPDLLIMLETERMRKNDKARNLLDALEMAIKDRDYKKRCEIVPVEQSGFLESIITTLEKCYRKYPESRWYVNLTGGTKPMAIAAYEFFKAHRSALIYTEISQPDIGLRWDTGGKEKFEHRVKFINIDEDEREDLIKYLFERQRIYLKERKK